MRVEKFCGHRRIIIEAGEFFALKGPGVISTLLGSCVAACLFDPVNKVMGMNHFMLSRKRYARDFIIRTEAGRYGVHAMELLINEMLKQGAEKQFLRAKAFGGSNLIGLGGGRCSPNPTVGDVNSRFIREFLNLEGIPLVAHSLGGTSGRMIHFSHGDFVVYMRRIQNTEQGRAAVFHNCPWQQRTSASPNIPQKNIELWQQPRRPKG